jgi:hypothetical protein
VDRWADAVILGSSRIIRRGRVAVLVGRHLLPTSITPLAVRDIAREKHVGESGSRQIEDTILEIETRAFAEPSGDERDLLQLIAILRAGRIP